MALLLPQVQQLIADFAATLAQVATSGDYNDLSNLPALGLTKIASALNVDGNALATTALTYESGCSLATYMPYLAVYKYNSGALGICAASLVANGAPLMANVGLLNVNSGANLVSTIVTTGVVVANTGNIEVIVGTASLGASSFDVEVYGVAY